MLFIDYGNTQSVKITELGHLPEIAKQKQPQAMECVLSEVQPSFVLNQKGLWSDAANQTFEKQTMGVKLFGKVRVFRNCNVSLIVFLLQVYSVVNNVVHLELYRNRTNLNVSLNSWLIQNGYGQQAEESYLSKVKIKGQIFPRYEY